MITENQLDVLLFENLVVSDECIAHCCPELVTGDKLAQVVIDLELRVLVVSLNHFLSLDEKAGIQRHISGQKRLLILAIDIGVGKLSLMRSGSSLSRGGCCSSS